MASTLGILDVLGRLREESERASTALALQEDTNRSLLHRCNEAEAESGRTVAAKDAVHILKTRLDQDWLLAECRRREAESRLKRLQAQQARREKAAVRKRQEAVEAADDAIESSKKFRADSAVSVTLIRELRSRLQDKRMEFESVQRKKKELDQEIKAKKITRDKVKAEVALRAEAVASACAAVDETERENKALLAEAKQREREVEEVRQAQEEIQEMAAGLHRKNAVLRNELRYLRRKAGGNEQVLHQRNQKRPCEGGDDDGGHTSDDGRAHRVEPGRPSFTARTGETHRSGGAARSDGSGVGQFYHHSPPPEQGKDRSSADLRFEAPSPYACQQHKDQQPRPTVAKTDIISINNTDTSIASRRRTSSSNVRAPFFTAATALAKMPELRLGSPHPWGRSVNQRKSTLGSSSTSNSGQGCVAKRLATAVTCAAMYVDSDEYGGFEYLA